jgi:hypothetical protein
MKIRRTFFMGLILISIIGCARYPKGLIHEIFEEAQEGDLSSFNEYLTAEGQQRYGNETQMTNIKHFLSENQDWEFALDHDYHWDGKNINATAYMAFLQKNNSVYWAKYKLQCGGSEVFADGQPYGVNCKVHEIEWPERIDEQDTQAAWNRALLHLAAYGCNWTDTQTLLNQVPKSDITRPLFPTGATPLGITKDRALSEQSRYSECRNTFQTLRYQNNSK